jgi:hypothetical protein
VFSGYKNPDNECNLILENIFDFKFVLKKEKKESPRKENHLLYPNIMDHADLV